MIPVNTGALGLLGILLLLGLLGLCGLLLLAVLLLRAGSRAALRRHPWRSGLLTLLSLLLSMPALLLLVELHQQQAAQQARAEALNPTLQEPLQLDGVHFPAGTRVQLQRLEPQNDWASGAPLAYGLASLQRASFSTPQVIRGLQVTALEAPSSYFYSSLQLAHDQTVEGWPCAATVPVEYRREIVDRLQPQNWRLQACGLQAQAHLAGVVWPAGSQLLREGDGWRLRYSRSDTGQPAVAHAGMQLEWLDMDLDAEGRPLRWQGSLAAPLRLGGVEYAARTDVQALAEGRLLFSPRRAPAYDHQRQRSIAPGRSLLQAADGRVLREADNAELGVIDWLELEQD